MNIFSNDIMLTDGFSVIGFCFILISNMWRKEDIMWNYIVVSLGTCVCITFSELSVCAASIHLFMFHCVPVCAKMRLRTTTWLYLHFLFMPIITV